MFPNAGGDEDSADEEPRSQSQDETETHNKVDPSITRGISSVASESQSPDEEDSNLDQNNEHQNCLVRTAQCLIRLKEKWPRTYALVFKVIIPLLSLIIISMIFGYWIAHVEAPDEIKKNNLAIAIRETLFHASQLERIIMRDGPLFCVKLYFDDQLGLVNDTTIEDYMVRELDYVNEKLYSALREGKNPDDIPPSLNETSSDLNTLLGVANITEIDDIPSFVQFIANCGEDIDEMMNHSTSAALFNPFFNKTYDIFYDNSITFNWIKCPMVQDNEKYIKISEGDSWTTFMETFQLIGAGIVSESVNA